MTEASFFERCAKVLADRWASLGERSEQSLPDDVVQDIANSINSNVKSYRYVLPTQVLAKVVDPALDARSMQLAWGVSGAFDARSIATRVIVPFDRENHGVFGGSGDPYVSKPLRDKAVIPELRGNKQNKPGWDALCRVLGAIESPESRVEADAVFDVVLHAIRARLETVRVVYPVPNRSSLESSRRAIELFLAARSGGVRFEAIVSALFETIGVRFGLFAAVRRTQVNAADSQAGAIADVDCLDADGIVVIAVEAKDREITIRDIEDKLPAFREGSVREAFFLTSQGSEASQVDDIDELVSKEFNSGQNIYVLELDRFLVTALSLFGEQGRREMLLAVGRHLDEFARLEDRQDWAEQLSSM